MCKLEDAIAPTTLSQALELADRYIPEDDRERFVEDFLEEAPFNQCVSRLSDDVQVQIWSAALALAIDAMPPVRLK